ncbi:hypothetical protein CTheo_8752 [Ceratobasidium theobromae]|uniref:Uncharacterized protein n=1 Tax=Ceratobasidium theobromae TaxID=1582974 RepID=A0A5N5Q8R1_9AGAM|nr:hypothetical protein CTheo_8752 [Ceratobasidium theobromae]
MEDTAKVWYLLVVQVQYRNTSLKLKVPNGSSTSLVNSAAQALIELLRPSFPFQIDFPPSLTICFMDVASYSEDNLDITFCSGLAALHALTEHLLNRNTGPLHIPTMQNSLKNFYKTTMRQKTLPDPSLPWASLCHEDGTLYGHQEFQHRPEWRLDSPCGTETSNSGYGYVYGHRRSGQPVRDSAASLEDFFLELQRTESTYHQDLLWETTGRSFDDLEEAILLCSQLLENVTPPAEGHPEAHSVEEVLSIFESAGGLKDLKNLQRMVVGVTPDAKHLFLDWTKDAHALESEWFLPSTDIDSLSLTIRDPELCMQASVYPYPDRGMTMSVCNELQVNIMGKLIYMHQCPNICFATIGPNNQFRINVFFPGLRIMTSSRRYRNYATQEEFQTWYDRVFLVALKQACDILPPQLRSLCESVRSALPLNYAAAEVRCTTGGQRTFLTYKVPHEILNRIFPLMRNIVNTTSELATYRDYFYHIFGINLKQIGFNVHKRADNNPIKYVFDAFPVVPWERQNPHNIMIDVGLELNLDQKRLPPGVSPSTLLWRQKQIQGLIKSGWLVRRLDPYCHSTVVGGFSATPRKGKHHGIVKLQVYMKDKVVTYVHMDRSVGTNFTAEDAIRKSQKYLSQVDGLEKVLSMAGSYGVRAEWRCSVWAARHILSRDPQRWVETMIHANALVGFSELDSLHEINQGQFQVCQPTQAIIDFKLALIHAYQYIFGLQHREHDNPRARLLAQAVCYQWKGLFKRPDDMSSSIQLATDLHMLRRVEKYGYPSISWKCIDLNSWYQVSEEVDPSTFRILEYSRQIRPGGQRLKTSHLHCVPKAKRQLREAIYSHEEGGGTNAVHTHIQASTTTAFQEIVTRVADRFIWAAVDEDMLGKVLNGLARWIWSRFPRKYQCRPPHKNENILKRKPLTLSRFQALTEPDVEIHGYDQPVNGFVQVIIKLFPDGWSTPPSQTTSLTQSLDQAYLANIRDHIASKPQAHRDAASKLMRNRLQLRLSTWQFLPAVRGRIIWPQTTGKNGSKPFAVYFNPSYSS